MKPSDALGLDIPDTIGGSPDAHAAVPQQPNEAPRPGIVVSLFRRHASRVRHSLSFRLRNEADAEDAAQEVFLKLWRQERQGNLREGATAYLNSAAASMATDIERWRAFHVTDRMEDVDVAEVHARGPDMEQQQHWRDAMARFVQAVEGLPKLARDAFVLYHVKGMTYVQIAAQLQVSVRTIERHIMQAAFTLERKLKDYL